MKQMFKKTVLAALIGYVGSAAAFTFETENVQGSFDSTITAGIGVRAQGIACDLVSQSPTGSGAPTGCISAASGLGDQGNLNYNRGDAFTTYLKGSHELLLKLPESVTFMGRVSWLKDFSATRTTDWLSVGNPTGRNQTDSVEKDLGFKARLLDLWVSKEFSVGEQRARVRVGNQVISWGESLFLPGGINQTNSMDFMRLSQPGTQLKEVFLPAPIVSVASGLGHGLNIEAYVQAKSDESYLPPTGSYWSTVNGLGKGFDEYGWSKRKAKDSNQYGVALRWQPEGTQLNLGAYAMSYHDKLPQLNLSGAPLLVFPENRKMYGVSANFPLGDWAIGTELSYRPRDAVALNPNLGCTGNDGNCFVDEKKFQWHVTGLLSMTPGDYPGILKLLGGAQTATLLAEVVAIKYPGLKRSYNGDPVSAGLWGWGSEFSGNLADATDVGSKTSWGYNFDFSWTYDGTVLPGWQMTPGVYFFHAVKGRTPNTMATFMEDAKSANFYLNFTQNPATWQFGMNYAKFWGGKTVFDQPLRDRDFFGAYVSRNF